MPNDGIQAYRSTNWKSPELALNRLHSSSVSAKTSVDTTSAMARDAGALCSSSPRTNSSSKAPATGSAISVVRIGKFIDSQTSDQFAGSRPQVIPQDQHDAEEQGRGI